MNPYIKTMLSNKGEVSTMRVLTTLCVLNAILMGLVAMAVSLYVVLSDKATSFDVMPFIGLCGTFLAPLLPKSVQSFAERGDKNV